MTLFLLPSPTFAFLPFLSRYGGAKLERARELFDQAVGGKCPPEACAELLLKYAT